MRQTAPALAATLAVALLLTGAVAPAAAAQPVWSVQSAQDDDRVHIYEGTHVSFRVADDELTDYAVDGETVVSSVAVQPADEFGAGVDLDAELSAVADVDGTGLDAESRSKAGATATAGGSTELRGHDNDHGVLVVRTDGDPQVVEANLSRGTDATVADDSRVAVTTANDTEGSFVVVGNGSVTVNGDGDVVAYLGSDSTLAFRAYPDGKEEWDERQEEFIADGTAAAEVHVMREDGAPVVDTITYAANTSVEATRTGERTVEVAVDRSVDEGKIVVTSVSERAMAIEALRVSVDGEAAAETSSYADLRGAVEGDEPAYLVAGGGAGATGGTNTDVLVALDGFSTRIVEVNAGERTATSVGETEVPTGESTPIATTNDDGQPGFGVVAVLGALAVAALVRRRR